MLGVFFRIGEQVCLTCFVYRHVVRAGTRPRDGPQLSAPALQLDQRFRRRADHGYVSERTVIHIRRRIDQAQGAIRLKGIQLVTAREARR